MTIPDVIVVGGGVVGAACARALAVRDVAVVLVDSGREPGIATNAAAGLLAPLLETGADPTLGLSVLARDFYRELVPALEEGTDINVGLCTEGILNLAFSDDDTAALKSIIAAQRQQGLNSDWLSEEDLFARCPGVSPDATGAMLAPEDGTLDPKALHQALLADAKRLGVTVRGGLRVDRVVIHDGRVASVVAGRESIAGANVFIAAGSWSSQIDGLPRPLSVAPIRGQMAALPWPDDEPPAVVYSGTGYVLHRAGEALVGTTMEHAGYVAENTAAGLQGVYTTMRRIYPKLDVARVTRTWAGLRPATPDGSPFVGPDPTVPGLWYATGHGRNGILLAGITGEILARQFTGAPPEADLRPLDPGRFWSL